MSVSVVEGTLLKAWGKLARGAIVKYDRVKAEGLKKRGILEYGRVELPEDVFADTVSREHTRRKKWKPENDEGSEG